MNKKRLINFVAKLLAEYSVYAPVRRDDRFSVGEIKDVEQIDWSGDMPENSFKAVFFPSRQMMFEEKNGRYAASLDRPEKIVACGVNILDLQAFTLVEHVFEKDIYYQKRRQNIFVVGFANGIEDDFRKYKAFHAQYEENILEHLIFDVFIERQKNGNFLFFSGSAKGQAILENNGVKDYENIEFAGLVPEAGIDQRIIQNRKAVELNEDNPLWDELAEICLACGKCSVVCPTCFCFDGIDQAKFDGTKKYRQWGNCFYPEFSKVSGGYKELDTVKKRLYFWYQHKFVRIPEELSYYGCVSCMRCFKVCPVGINIAKNLQRLKVK